MLKYDLLTPHAEALDTDAVLCEYPRPQLQRDSYLNLNGIWQYGINRDGTLSDTSAGTICVPFSPESILSGVTRVPKRKEYAIYTRVFTVPQGFLKDVTWLHIGAVDQECEVFVNGRAMGRFANGYLPVDVEVTAAIREGENCLQLRVRDTLDYRYPTGKQRKKRGGIWYTPISGVWQTVWLESVPTHYIRQLRITPDVDAGCVDLEVDTTAKTVSVRVSAGESVLCEHIVENNRIRFAIPQEQQWLWSPEHPFLYDLTVRTEDDTVTSYFALRKFTAEGQHFFLNNRPYFINGLLDQGYFSDGIYTPASYEAFTDDILAAKRLGFNALRKHIKVEPLRFYYECDRLGILVLQDMMNVGKYNFLKDTVLPMAGVRARKPFINVNAAQKAEFTAHAAALVRYLYNCPSVVYYTIFNEGWGQFDGDGQYALLKPLDATRVFDATSGWFRETLSDVVSEHIYFRPLRLKRQDRTHIISEFGGYSYACPDHVFNTGKTFGYKVFDTREAFEEAFIRLYEQEVEPSLSLGLAGVVYTQLSDVEDECNGLLTYDRRVCKVQTERVYAMMQRIIHKANRRLDAVASDAN